MTASWRTGWRTPATRGPTPTREPRAGRFRVLDESGSRALVEITLHEGRKHIVRRMLDEVGHPVSRLVRTTVGPVKLGSLRPGVTRDLSTKEIGALYGAVGLESCARGSSRKRRKRVK